jgi:hypothetical protein
MATGGIFQLITNDGKQDRMLMASALLKQRIHDASKRIAATGAADTTPTLYDIERTHILFTNAHFKPFAAIGYEYNKVSSTSGSSTLGGNLTFSIPQFGDFFNDMVVHAIISQPQLETMVNGVSIEPSKQNLMRWCAYPGERLLKTVKFEVNGNPLDEYTSDAVNYHREFLVQPNKETAWNRCVGQEESQVGYVDQPNWIDSGVESADITYRTKIAGCGGLQTPTGQKTGDVELFIPLLFWCNKDPRLAVPSVAIPYGQRFITLELATAADLVGEVARGVAPGTEYTQTNITAGGAFKSDSMKIKTLELYINNIFVNPEVHNIFIKRIGFTLIRVHRLQIHQSTGAGSESVLLQNLKWPVEALFVGMRVSDYHNTPNSELQRKHLDKWHTFSSLNIEDRENQGWKSDKATVKTAANMLELIPEATDAIPSVMTAGTSASIGFSYDPNNPASAINYVGVGDIITLTSAIGNTVGPMTIASITDDGSSITFVEDSTTIPNYDDINGVDIMLNPNIATDFVVVQHKSEPLSYKVSTCSPNITDVTIKAHGIPIYNNFPNGFFNAYLPYNYGGNNIRAPHDCGALMITFCLYPGTYQPSGHINISRAREFYIDYTVQNIDNTTRGTLVVVASAINFLLISDGSAVLRYST